jgi:hypothetical protein
MARAATQSGLADTDHIHLDRWEEVIGELEAITIVDGQVLVELPAGTLAYPTHSVEAARLQEALRGMEGRTVGILRTDDPESSLEITVK